MSNLRQFLRIGTVPPDPPFHMYPALLCMTNQWSYPGASILSLLAINCLIILPAGALRLTFVLLIHMASVPPLVSYPMTVSREDRHCCSCIVGGSNFVLVREFLTPILLEAPVNLHDVAQFLLSPVYSLRESLVFLCFDQIVFFLPSVL